MTTIGTAERILDVTQELIQRQGYNAISFDRVAQKVGIKKPSIVHHYPSKAALGLAVVRRYRSTFAAALEKFMAGPEKSATEALEFYFAPYADIGESEDKVCLCGSLAGELSALPAEVQDEVSLFFENHREWLTSTLSLGKKIGEFQFDDDAESTAGLVLSALQGALIVGRATGNSNHVPATILSLKSKLGIT